MAIDILNIKPSVISRDLRGKYVLLYGKPRFDFGPLSSNI